ncbi:hypothetical protein PZB75_13215 [Streptomyces sp. AM 4-1-1]|uniref:hypothetical protein n=2 Tax=unclassified Streptomyces TaxID=2593676 RepID=UPI0023B8C7BE|nr:hypothetical protein [Streptomyces sp. AM 4-1-1]WEH34237.1 hypothetical protein PZB75_13215 [Streptomyces sp. AM 4-1-1]
MRPAPQPPPHPTATAASTPVPTARIAHGFRYEALHYAGPHQPCPTPVDLRIVTTPHEAIRAIRAHVRTLSPDTMTTDHHAAALNWADEGGWTGALASLHRGQPCGFSLRLRRGVSLEWCVRPVTYLTLHASGAGPRPELAQLSHRSALPPRRVLN